MENTMQHKPLVRPPYTYKFTCLAPGDVIEISESAKLRALQEFPNSWSLRLGHQVQYTHDELLIAAGYAITPSTPRATYDRTYNSQLQDDKVATWCDKHGNLKDFVSPSHTITQGERDHWKNLWKNDDKDTVIHSFEYTDPTHTKAVYLGPISFALAEPFLNAGENSYYLPRASAYRGNLLVG